MNYDQVNKRHLAEGMELTYRTSDQSYIEKARQAEPIGTIKQMGGREVIKTANGWRAHTKGSASRTKDHLEKNPSANHKDEHLEKFSKETPESELKRVIKESTDPRLREHANKELARRKEEESGKEKKKEEPKQDTKEAHEKRGFDEKKGDEDVTGKSEKIPGKKSELSKEGIDAARAHSEKMKKLLSNDEDTDFDLKGENPYSKGQKVSYATEDRFENKWDEHTKVVANHPSGHVLLENGAKMHHTELQKKEHKFKSSSKK